MKKGPAAPPAGPPKANLSGSPFLFHFHLKLEGSLVMPHFPKPFFKPSRGTWYVQLDGRQINLGPDQDKAFTRYHELMNRPRPTTITSEALVLVIDAFLDWVSKHRAPDTYLWYRYRLERFAKRYPNLSTAQLRPYHVQQWLDSLDGLSSGSLRNHCRAIKRCLRWAEQQGYVDKNPIAHLEQPKAGKREVVLSPTEFADILTLATNPSFRDLLVVTWETGCRPQESLRVEARHVDVTNQRWVFPKSESKTGFLRVVYLTDKALAITKRLMLRHPSGPLFRNSRGEAWTTDAVNCVFTSIQIKMGRRILEQRTAHKTTDGRCKYNYFDESQVQEFARALKPCKQSGQPKTKAVLMHEARKKLTRLEAMKLAPKYSLYTLRHSWATLALERGLDALTVAILMGHQDPSTLAKVYQHLSHNPSHLLAQAKRAAAG